MRNESQYTESQRFSSFAAQSFVSELKKMLNEDVFNDEGKKAIIQRIEEKLLDNKYLDIIEILKQNKDINIFKIWDRKGLTLIHRMTLHMKINEVKFIVQYGCDYLKDSAQKNKIIKKWINFQNEDGFTALHYASFKGDVEITRYLISQGSNALLVNKNGLNVLHIAAQGDQPISICYFDSLGVDLNLTDHKGGTALHWACYLGSENAVNYLVSKMKDKLNNADGEGLTPLHLAVISGNARVVRKLLQRGANRNALDNNQKTPAQLADENEFHNIQQMLEKTGGFQEYCNIKQPFKPMDKNPRQLLVLFLLLFFSQGTIIAFIIPCLSYHYIELGIWAFFLFGTLFSLFFAWLKNPGEVNGIVQNKLEQSQNISENEQSHENQFDQAQQSTPRLNEHITRSNVNNSMNEAQDLNQNLIQDININNQISDLSSQKKTSCKQREVETLNFLISLYQNNDVSKICVECCIVKPKRSRHCEICKKCIRVYDHHCPWINNCVGANNYKYFIMFILFMWFNMLVGLLLILFHITSNYSDEHISQDSWIFNWYSDLSAQTQDTIQIVKYVVSGLVTLLIIFFFVLHSILCFVQLNNLFLNQTTFERYNTHQQHGNEVDNNGDGANVVSSKKSEQSSTTDANPSIIQSNSRTSNQQNRNKLVYGVKKVSFKNAYLMCIQNSKDPQYDYAPPIKNINNNQQQSP
ncbi:DHHC zinc finger protein (macronuclear) [Tetrahymena thermophila SB210]|uniref:Palmitoyltransferase n=1 Tax=Tetrahymena thermophila (strain SB210) TaxID=312017 RepID=Q23E77_TETTS|nr:DHHC zinc finger protein [Tetrahymena thermophila SB210]EAR94876.1 DHHC zinc finger protein [Tetrahymena thermophila SB210]|eukprot:XP_001015121.1 DHHC zinc finger protein [Tetrahymena thermophila SB210]